MVEVGLVFIGMLGLMLLDTPKNNENKEIHDNNFNKDFFRENLNSNHYDNFMLDEVTHQMKDSYLMDEFKYLRRNGLSVERAIDELVSDGKIKF